MTRTWWCRACRYVTATCMPARLPGRRCRCSTPSSRSKFATGLQTSFALGSASTQVSTQPPLLSGLPVLVSPLINQSFLLILSCLLIRSLFSVSFLDLTKHSGTLSFIGDILQSHDGQDFFFFCLLKAVLVPPCFLQSCGRTEISPHNLLLPAMCRGGFCFVFRVLLLLKARLQDRIVDNDGLGHVLARNPRMFLDTSGSFRQLAFM